MTGIELILVGLLLGPSPEKDAAAASNPLTTSPQERKPLQKRKASKSLRVRWDHRPEIRKGEWLELDLRFKSQGLMSGFSSDSGETGDYAGLRRLRLGVEGRLWGSVDFQAEFEVNRRDRWLRDAWAGWKANDRFGLQAGRFKIPFGRDQLTGPMQLDFAWRSRLGDQLAPARDNGVLVHGRLLRKSVAWESGIFAHDGDNSLDSDRRPTAGRTLAARIMLTPRRILPLPGLFKGMDFGIAATHGNSRGRSVSLRAQTGFGDSFFKRIEMEGARTRLGAEFSWSPGPFGFQAETARVREGRRGLSLRGTDLPDVLSQAWYAQSTWFVTGESKDGGRVRPKRSFAEGGFGAVELAVRREYFGMRSATDVGTPSLNPRGANLRPATLHGWTFGINWYPDRYFKAQFNWVADRVDAFSRSQLSAPHTRTWVISLQAVL